MTRAGGVTPAYGFEAHMGYGTKRHRSAITEHGAVSRLHRMSFAPLRDLGPSLPASERRNTDQPLVEAGDKHAIDRQPA